MKDEQKDIVVRDEPRQLTPQGVLSQVQDIQRLMAEVMKKDEHYGVIPGSTKPTLLKAGAEKLSLMFRLAPEYDVIEREHENGHREYRITCTLYSIVTGVRVGQGVGVCSTLESKYRYREVSDFEVMDEPIPEDAKERKKEYRAQGYGMKKIDGQWAWVKYKDTHKEENQNIADTYNTVLKMGKKRAHVDAILTATAASDIFAQDLEDLTDKTVVVRSTESDKPEFLQEPKAGEPRVVEDKQCDKCYAPVGKQHLKTCPNA